jgi:hypothetical protein
MIVNDFQCLGIFFSVIVETLSGRHWVFASNCGQQYGIPTSPDHRNHPTRQTIVKLESVTSKAVLKAFRLMLSALKTSRTKGLLF